ncbi:peptidase S9 [Kitasatospora sp. MMS16-BH015]|uniref:prolyl oligopeptidase family serine peptidase n=1 Tax=Kitasatospora sp. MMS16-BH015 TaxID=2018025 RepID=UPI000CA37AC9|nr:prolyl oligopeptidase family serine peptidase [Kitasatospora sp. MMS16-BH015]AUG78994.1 peptidase S9 [Kitasatospora sp. MMS16-BH015]
MLTYELSYPPAPRAELTEELHGHLVADPYRALEEAGSPTTKAWSAAQDELFRAARAGWAGLGAFDARVRQLLATGMSTAPLVHGDRAFNLRQRPDQDQPALYVAEGGRDRVLFDPAVFDPSGASLLEEWSVAPAGDRVAVQTSSGGTEDSELRVLCVATGAVLDGPIDRVRRSTLAWLPDGSGFYYVRRLPPELHPGEERYHRRVWLHLVDTDPAEDTLVFGEGRPAEQHYAVATDGRLLTVTATAGASPRTDVYAAVLAEGPLDRPALRPVQEGVDAATTARPYGGVLHLATCRDAPRGRLELADPVTGERRVLLPEHPEAVLEDFAVLDGPELPRPLLLATYTRHAISEITVHCARTGEPLGEVELPGAGTVGPLRPRRGPFEAAGGSGAHELWFAYADHVTPSRALHYDARTGRTTPWAAPAGSPRTTVRVRQVVYPGLDGTPVRMFVISPTGTPDRPRPTVITGYGGFGARMVPGYAAQAVAWAEAGGVYVFACLRGGGEEGEGWHRAGRREHKQRTFDDLHAAADWLTAEGWASGIGLVGSSNGGLTVGAALTQRPERYAAVVCVAPLLDMVRYEHSGLGPSWRDEYGSAAEPAELAWLLAYSPYHAVRPGTVYPAVLFGVADGDTRVDPLHARKMCAALQHAGAPGSGPVLLRQETGVGHGLRGVDATAALLADQLAFLADRLGI